MQLTWADLLIDDLAPADFQRWLGQVEMLDVFIREVSRVREGE